MSEETLTCPTGGSENVATAAEQMFMVNTGEHYCHSVKSYDANARALCLACRWEGVRQDLAAQAGEGGV